MNQAKLANILQRDGVLKTPEIISAFENIDRADFLSEELRSEAYENIPLPIGYGQTVSQPWTVAFMLELLQPKQGQNIFDIGSGSGWQTSLLASIVNVDGHVTALELIPELYEKSIASLNRYGFIQQKIVEVHCMDASHGFIDNAPYDRIIVAAMIQKIPTAWIEQLASGGIIVLPMRGSLWRFAKGRDGHITQDEYPGFAFVPFNDAGNRPNNTVDAYRHEALHMFF